MLQLAEGNQKRDCGKQPMLTGKCGRTLETEAKRGEQTTQKQKQRKSEERVDWAGVFQLPRVAGNGKGRVREGGSKGARETLATSHTQSAEILFNLAHTSTPQQMPNESKGNKAPLAQM